ncbi:doubled CXXCH motif [bacterium BMS3Abin10]|nr:doubled CXXCH motif [bacterium BMS3Abin10]
MKIVNCKPCLPAGRLSIVCVLFFIISFPGLSQTLAQAPQNPDSAKECAICHYRWIDTFYIHGKGSDLVPYQSETVAAKSEKVKIPEDLIKKGAKLGWNGEIICQTCHKVHNNKIEKQLLLIKKDEKSTLCLTCHTDKQYLADTKHNLIHLAPKEKNLEGKTVAQTGICSACHLPHKAARKLPEEEDFTTGLCLSCHSKGNIARDSIPQQYSHPLNVRPYEEKGDLILTTMSVGKEELTLPLFNKYGVHDKDGYITCTTCHDPHRWRADSTEGEIREDVKGDKSTSFLRKASPDICRECHNDKFYIANSKHDLSKVAPEEKNILKQTPEESGLCETCHLVHGGQKDYLWARKITTKNDNIAANLCISCHNEKGMAKEKVIKDYSHPVNISALEKDFTTTLPLFDKNGKLSKTGYVTCPTCHDPHRWDPVKADLEDHSKIEGNARNSFLRLENWPSPKLCANCHPDKMYVEKTDHDLLVTAPDSKNAMGQTPAESGACGVCHVVHNGKYFIKLWARDLGMTGNIMDMMCNSCHSENGSAKTKVPEVASHPKNQLITNIGRNVKGRPNYFPLFDIRNGKPVTVGDISCSSCHDVHQWDPRFYKKGPGKNTEGNATNSFLRRHTYGLMCIDCHGLDALFRFKYYHEPSERKSKG